MLFVDKGSDYARTHKKKANNSPPVMLNMGEYEYRTSKTIMSW
jgi:hypothetical protein